MNLSAKITAFFLAQNIIPAQEREIYEYGFALLIADFINFFAIFIVGILCQQTWETILYIIILCRAPQCSAAVIMPKTHLKCHICNY
ncbi:MAG: accessory gene regulator B family protein [Butyricicoccaceae bacterium]